MGHHVGNGASSPQDAKVEAVSNFAIPMTMKDSAVF